MNKGILYLITFLHTLFVLFILLTPITNNTHLLLLHAITVPFIIAHWISNNNMCALTLLEQEIRKNIYGISDKQECFTCRLIEPVYDFAQNNCDSSYFIYTITISLWIVTMYKLYGQYNSGELMKQLFMKQ